MHVFLSESISASNESDDIEVFRYLVLFALSIGDDNSDRRDTTIALLSAAV